jgi:hypothetical protein
MEMSSAKAMSPGRGDPKSKSSPQRFSYPHQLVRDPYISLEEKRALLTAWALDRYAVKSFPALRHLPGTPFPVALSSIIDARAYLDRISSANDDDPRRPPGATRALPANLKFQEAA